MSIMRIYDGGVDGCSSSGRLELCRPQEAAQWKMAAGRAEPDNRRDWNKWRPLSQKHIFQANISSFYRELSRSAPDRPHKTKLKERKLGRLSKSSFCRWKRTLFTHSLFDHVVQVSCHHFSRRIVSRFLFAQIFFSNSLRIVPDKETILLFSARRHISFLFHTHCNVHDQSTSTTIFKLFLTHILNKIPIIISNSQPNYLVIIYYQWSIKVIENKLQLTWTITKTYYWNIFVHSLHIRANILTHFLHFWFWTNNRQGFI